MSELVQVALAQDPIEAEEIQALLDEHGIASEVQPDGESDGLKVLVAESAVEAAQDAIELPSESDDAIPEV
jgi:type III secretory pathway lipoprotein EscJ